MLNNWVNNTEALKFRSSSRGYVMVLNPRPSVTISLDFLCRRSNRSFGQIHLDFEKTFTSVMPVFKKIIVDLKNFFNCVSLCFLVFSSSSSFSSVCFSDLKCDKWINVLIHVLACKYKKACQWAELLICEGVFEYSSSFSSFSLLFFLILKQIKKCYDLSMQI